MNEHKVDVNNDIVVEKKEEKKKFNWKIPVIIFVVLILIVVAFIFKDKIFKKENPKKVEPVKVTSPYRMSSNSLEKFDLSFLQLENKEENIVYSPLSIKYALSMLKDGSSENTYNEINAVVGDYKSKKYTNNSNMSFANAMFIRDTFKDSINEKYTSKLNNNYNAEIIYDKFENASTMNKWVSDKTFNLINNLFDDNVVKKEDFIITNALAIDMQWKNLIQPNGSIKFKNDDENYNKGYNVRYSHEKYYDYVEDLCCSEYSSLKFNNKINSKSVQIGASINNYDIVKTLGEDNIRKTVGEEYRKWLESEEAQLDLKYNPSSVETDVDKFLDKYVEELNSNYKRLDASTDFMLYDDESVKVFAKDLKKYGDTTLQYVGIMPKTTNLNEYIKNIDSKKLNDIINNLKEVKTENFKEGVVTKIKGSLPLFKFEYSLDLMNDLNKLGIKDVFDSIKSNLSKMTSSKAYIGDASHKATIEFSNEGIKAAAATELGGLGAANGGFEYLYEVPVEEIDLTFDNPYLFLIRDKDSGEVWFVGSVYEPIEKV